MEWVLKDLNDRAAPVEAYRHHIEPARAIVKAIACDVVERELRDPPLLESGDRFGSLTERPPAAGLHLDEHERPAVSRDDVQFAAPLAVAAGQHCGAPPPHPRP